MSSESKSRELSNWRPRTLGEVYGNRRLVKSLRRMLATKQTQPNMLIGGAPGLGKTALLDAFCRAWRCKDREVTSDICCGKCDRCTTRLNGEGGGAINDDDILYWERSLIYADASQVILEHLEERISDVFNSDHCIVFIDEAHCLSRRRIQQSLLVKVERSSHMWIFATALTKELDPMLVRRCTPYEVRPLSDEDAAAFITDRCRDYQIDCSDKEAVICLIERANGNGSRILRCLSEVLSDGGKLTVDAVDEFQFDIDA
jgi:replication-associated recombination protein RarA